MAVIESKGDGFALYNGVKLPKLPEWDKVKYPYVTIVRRGSQGSTYLLFVSTVPYTMRVTEAGVIWIEYGHHIRDNYSAAVDGTEWELVASDVEISENYIVFPAIWTNYDIINTDDNTVYLAASEPISLDGMNVIEWDGDTTGLETFGGAIAYRVSSATDVDVSKTVCAVRRTADKAVVISGVLTKKDGFYQNAVSRYVCEASETYPNVGIYLLEAAAIDVPLFAYYPIAEEQPEIDRGTLFILYRMFSPAVFHALTGKNHWSD